jgi:hypothetical protein
MGNLGGIIVQLFLGLAILNSSKTKGIRIIVFFMAGYILYEAIQPLLPKGVFDWKDVYGTLIGGVIGLLMFLLLQKLIKRNKIFYRL